MNLEIPLLYYRIVILKTKYPEISRILVVLFIVVSFVLQINKYLLY